MAPGAESLPVISGRFSLLRQIGSGGVGVVYEAFDRENSMRVALKTLREVNPSRIYLLKQEFRALTGLVHPNLVNLYELFSEGGEWFFTMEYVDGVDFLTYVRGDPVTDSDNRETMSLVAPPGDVRNRYPAPSHHSLPAISRPDQFARLRRAFPQLIEGVQALHDAGMIHRDIKPSNVLVTREGRVALLDFGLVTNLPGTLAGREGSLFNGGTPGYMSPEQAHALELTPASDWFSAGVMLFETLTGRLPFPEPPDPRSAPQAPHIGGNVPDELCALCLHMLALSPERRPRAPEILGGLGASSRAVRRAAHVFVGREEPFAALRAALADLRAGYPRAIYVNGPSGIGKSELIRQFLEEAATDPEILILTGRCCEQESVPYKAIDGVIDALTRVLTRMPDNERLAILPRDTAALARAFPVLRRTLPVSPTAAKSMEAADPQELRRRVPSALRDLFGRLGDRRPLVIYVDDLQWGDIESAGILAGLMGMPDAPAMLFLGSYRTGNEDNAVIRALLGSPRETSIQRREIALGPLTLEETGQLVRSLTGASAGAEGALRIWNEAGGSPYLVRELGQALGAGEALAPGESTLESVLWRRVSALPAEARLLLELAAVCGQPLEPAELFAAAGLSQRDPGALAALRAGRLLRAGAGSQHEVELYHDRVREVVTARLDPEVRRERHRSLAAALESLGRRSAEILAVHFRGAAETAKALHYYSAAADEAFSSLAFRHAAELYGAACDLARPSDPRLGALETRMAESLANSGRGADAAEVYLRAANRPGAATVELERCAAFHYCSTGHLREGLAAFRRTLAAVGWRMPETQRRAMVEFLWVRLRLLLRGTRLRLRPEDEIPPALLRRIDVSWSAGCSLGTIDLVTGALFTARSLLLALQVGEARRLARALPWEAITSANLGPLGKRRAARLLALCGPLTESLGQPHARGMLALCTGLVEFVSCRFLSAIPYLSSAERIFREECIGEYWGICHAQSIIANSLLMLGRWPELIERTEEGLARARDRGDLYTEVSLGTISSHIRPLCAGDAEAARKTLDSLQSRWPAEGYHTQHALAALTRTDIFLYADEGAEGVAFLDSQWPLMQQTYFSRNDWFRFGHLAGHARCALAAAVTQPRYLETAAGDLRRLERANVPTAKPCAAAVRAGIQFLRGDRAGALASLQAAAKAAESLDLALFRAAVELRAAVLSGASTDTAMAAFRAAGVTNPVTMSRLFVAGLPE